MVLEGLNESLLTVTQPQFRTHWHIFLKQNGRKKLKVEMFFNDSNFIDPVERDLFLEKCRVWPFMFQDTSGIVWVFLLSFASVCPLKAGPSYWEPDEREVWMEETGRNKLELKPSISMKWLKCSHARQDHTAVVRHRQLFWIQLNGAWRNIQTSEFGVSPENILRFLNTRRWHSHITQSSQRSHTSLVLCQTESRAASRKAACHPGV